jgi:hypothetical protein
LQSTAPLVVDISDFEMESKAWLIKNGVPKEVMDRLIPEK